MKKIINLLRVCVFMIAMAVVVVSCEKKTDPPQVVPVLGVKLQKMEKFISVAWGTPLSQISFNANSNEFLVGKLLMKKDSVEKLYDVANEYKLNFEK